MSARALPGALALLLLALSLHLSCAAATLDVVPLPFVPLAYYKVVDSKVREPA
jgi:hypothetical protein